MMHRAFARSCGRAAARSNPTRAVTDRLRVVKPRSYSIIPWRHRTPTPATSLLNGRFPFDSIFESNRSLLPNVFNELDRIASTMLESTAADARRSFGIDVEESDKAYVVKADLPGFAKEDVSISFKDDVLTISGEKKQESKNEKQHIVERSYGQFSRSLRLPTDANPEDIKATLNNGVLSVTVAKRELPPEKAPKKIEIE